MTRIITHRGLDPSRAPYFLESSREAFTDHLERGYGIEFDVRKTRDGSIIITHDATLARISEGADTRAVGELDADDILALSFGGCHLTDLSTLLDLIEEKQATTAISALHLKSAAQDRETLDIILSHLRGRDMSKLLVFDVTLASATYLKEHYPALMLAPSLAHPFDIARYKRATGGTLYALEEVLANRALFDWVWGDEWDLSDHDGRTKTLYNEETFAQLRSAGLKIALVTPELHGTSPGLLGGEAHPDAKDHETLFARMRDILALNPDAVCTDYPDAVKDLAVEITS